jgi:hypothetical protein
VEASVGLGLAGEFTVQTSNSLGLLLSSTWFWVVVILIILIIAFRAQLARLIDRLQKARIEAGKDGAKVEIDSPIPAAAEKPLAPSSPQPASATSPVSLPSHTVEVGRGAIMQNVTTGDIANVIIKSGEPRSGPIQPQLIASTGVAAGWTTERIRELLAAAFSDDELTSLCFDHFRPVYQDFSTGMSTGQKIQRLLEYCERHNRVDELLSMVQQRNPYQFARFQGQTN